MKCLRARFVGIIIAVLLLHVVNQAHPIYPHVVRNAEIAMQTILAAMRYSLMDGQSRNSGSGSLEP
jgi:hypothetical protein